MRIHNQSGPQRVLATAALLLTSAAAAADTDAQSVDYLNFANGVLPERVGGMAAG